jgi:AraC-like DNA-binding protein
VDCRGGMQRVIDYVQRRLEKPLGLDDLSKVAALSPLHFARLFAVFAGCPPLAYLRRRKMLRAGHSLRSPLADNR